MPSPASLLASTRRRLSVCPSTCPSVSDDSPPQKEEDVNRKRLSAAQEAVVTPSALSFSLSTGESELLLLHTHTHTLEVPPRLADVSQECSVLLMVVSPCSYTVATAPPHGGSRSLRKNAPPPLSSSSHITVRQEVSSDSHVMKKKGQWGEDGCRYGELRRSRQEKKKVKDGK